MDLKHKMVTHKLFFYLPTTAKTEYELQKNVFFTCFSVEQTKTNVGQASKEAFKKHTKRLDLPEQSPFWEQNVEIDSYSVCLSLKRLCTVFVWSTLSVGTLEPFMSCGFVLSHLN
jgi:hypothetical protein